MRHLRGAAAALALATAVTSAMRSDGSRVAAAQEPTEDGRVILARLRWKSDGASYGRGGSGAAWNHDYPRAEQHLSLIVKELTAVDISTRSSVVVALDDPDLFRYPIALMWEPGFWNLTDAEAAHFRRYLLKGGFVIFEDFDGAAQWEHFEAQIRRVLPEARLVRLSGRHGIFDTFFRIRDVEGIVHPMYGLRPSYHGIFEENDPAKRLMVVANFDNDVPEYWEWSGQGVFPFDASNEAYKLGVNYVIYGLTH